MNKLLYILAFCLLAVFPAHAQSATDTAKVKQTQTKPAWKPNPAKAAIFSTVLPSAGQIYNRKYWKAPIIYAGFGGLIYATTYNNSKYQDYKTAYNSIADTDPNTNDYINYIPAGLTPETVDMAWLSNALNSKQMQFRRYRDLSIIGMVALYGLNILDAYIDAQLYDFDISTDLSLHVEPMVDPTTINYGGATFGLRCQFTF